MAWLGNFKNLSSNLGNLGDLAGAVSKLQESVKSIERNFDSALGFDSTDARDVSSPLETRADEDTAASPIKDTSDVTDKKNSFSSLGESTSTGLQDATIFDTPQTTRTVYSQLSVQESPSDMAVEVGETISSTSATDLSLLKSDKDVSPQDGVVDGREKVSNYSNGQDQLLGLESQGNFSLSARDEQHQESGNTTGETGPVDTLAFNIENKIRSDRAEHVQEGSLSSVRDRSNGALEESPVESSSHETKQDGTIIDHEKLPVGVAFEPEEDSKDENKLKSDLKMMEAALQGAAKQAQMKADEILRLLGENEKLKSANEELKAKSSDVELVALREEYQQRLGAAERKVYALTKERDMLRREQSRKNDSSILLKEKDEIIKQVMMEGEELSKKQAVLEGTVKKLRAQIRELEEEKQRLNSKLQVEEGKVESIRKDKIVTEKALQDAVERGQTELAALREYYTTALNEAKDAEAQAEARAGSEAKADLDRRCQEAADREAALLQSLNELRQAISATEQQAAYQEDMLRGDLEDLERRCQAAEARYDELLASMPDSTRPLMRQIEGMEVAAASKGELWAMQERALNSRLQEAEAKAAASQERERAVNERMSQTLSRMAVMEAQLSCLRAEQNQLSRSLEKERLRASESRQEYLAAMERAATFEGRAKQGEETLESLRAKHKQDLKEERIRRLALEQFYNRVQDIERERAAAAEYEKRLGTDGQLERQAEKPLPSLNTPAVSLTEFSSNHTPLKRVKSSSSAGSVEEGSYVLNAVDTGYDIPPSSERLSFKERSPSPYTPIRHLGLGLGSSVIEQLEAQLRQKEGELSSCFARLGALESTRDSLAEELVKITTQNETYRAEASFLPGLRSELESLRRRHTSALELMGERDEEVEELKADLADVKQMYREQITMLVGQIERLSASMAST